MASRQTTSSPAVPATSTKYIGDESTLLEGVSISQAEGPGAFGVGTVVTIYTGAIQRLPATQSPNPTAAGPSVSSASSSASLSPTSANMSIRSTVTTTVPGSITVSTLPPSNGYVGPIGEYTVTTTVTPTNSVEAVTLLVETGAFVRASDASTVVSSGMQTASTPESASASGTAASGNATTSGSAGGGGGGGGNNSGAIAGAAVGSAIGAALIAFLLTFFLCVRKRRNNPRGGVYMTEKPSPAHAWDAFLPQSADDGTIQRSANALYSQIDMHVENYYGSNAMATVSMESRAALQKVDGGILPNSVEELMRETTTPLPVIKHCFAWVILSRLSPAAHSESSLLPPELARMPPRQSGSKGRSDREEKAMDQAYPYWRVLTAHLLYPRSSNASQSMSSQGAAEVLTTLTAAFQPWSKKVKSGASASEHLSSVLKTATETGLLILSQPSTFGFEWDVLDTARAAPGIASSTVVVLPAFEKTADERGEALAQRYVLAKPKVEAISL